LLQRVGKTEESLTSFKTLFRESPDDENLKSEYAAALLQAGRYNDAKRVVSEK
jgi:hypothetical protein